MSFDITTFVLFKLRYKAYALKLQNINDEKEIDAILDELDSLKGCNRKIILIDDAHKLSFESKLRWEFEEEAKDKVNGKFIWINTNYLNYKQSDTNESISISFESFYPKLLKELYGSHHSVIKDVINNKCSALGEAMKLKEKGEIKDPWHFNFIATNGEYRIINLLQKLSDDKEKQDTLLLSVFLFSCRNILTGEKEINQTEFAIILNNIEVPYFKKPIETYRSSNIISDLSSQERGRFLIIENKGSLDRGFLRSPHFKSSIAIVRSVVTDFSDKILVWQILMISKILLTDNYRDSKYFGIYFNLLGNYQEYFLSETKDWIRKFSTNLILDQLHVYPPLLSLLKKNHNSFYKELITDDYFSSIASVISVAPATRFTSIQKFIRVLGNDKEKLVQKLNWETLANAANKAEVTNFGQLEAILNALGNDKEKLVQKLNWETLANAANKAEVTNFGQLEAILNALGNDKEALVQKLNWETLANAANKAEVTQLKQVADFINALGNDKEALVQKLNWETLANAANKAEVTNFGQLEAILNALGNNKEILVQKLNWETLANAANKAEVTQLKQVADFINALGNNKEILVQKLNWETLANAANKAEITQLNQVANFINALGNYKEKLSVLFEEEKIITHFKNTTWKQVSPLCIIIASLETERQNSLIIQCNWVDVLNKINLTHSLQIKSLSYILYYQNKKQAILKLPIANHEIIIYLENNREKIVLFSTQYFISPDDFQVCSNLLAELLPHSSEICRNITEKIKLKIIKDFNISPRHYQGFANLLNIISQINPILCKKIISDNTVKSRLYASFKDVSIVDQLVGLQSLLDSIKNIDPLVLAKIIALQSIRDLRLHEIGNNYTN